jgi:hypothetical protein
MDWPFIVTVMLFGEVSVDAKNEKFDGDATTALLAGVNFEKFALHSPVLLLLLSP